MWKNCNIVMLSTEKASNIHYVPIKDSIGTNFEEININGIKELKPLKHSKLLYTEEETEYGYPPQHLYITSVEKIKENDWVLITCSEINLFDSIEQYNNQIDKIYCKKIMASTNKSLNLPQIPQSFIEHYIEKYNKRNIISKVLVEYKEESLIYLM